MIVAAIGVVLLVLLAVDVFSTVFSPRGLGGPVNRRQNRLIWRIVRALGRGPDGSAREGWLALAGPVMVAMTLGGWVVWLIVSFALIYYPWMQSFLVSPGALRSHWVEALYYSGYTAATLGFGDVVPDSEALRLLAPIEAAGGFALVSVSVTYFLAVYGQVFAVQSLAADISALFMTGQERLLEFIRTEGPETVARWSEGLANNLSKVLLAHFQFPVLYYFRPSQRSRALPVQLGTLLRLRRAVRPDDDRAEVSSLARHPSYLALQHALEEYLAEVDTLFAPDAGEARESFGSEDSLEHAHQRLLDHMLYS